MAKWINDLLSILLSRKVGFTLLCGTYLSIAYDVLYVPSAPNTFYIVITMIGTLLAVIGLELVSEYTLTIETKVQYGIFKEMSKLIVLHETRFITQKGLIRSLEAKISLLEQERRQHDRQFKPQKD